MLINVPINVTAVTTSMVCVTLDVNQDGGENTVKKVVFILFKVLLVITCFDIYILVPSILLQNRF